MKNQLSDDGNNSVLSSLEQGELKSIPMDSIITDDDNPGWNEKSLRRKVQTSRIREATKMMNGITVVPIVVCKDEHKKGVYLLIDGHGRVVESENNGETTIDARVFNYLDPVQRIALREILNSGQAAFDVTVQLADVILAAKKQNLDVRDAEDAAEVLSIFPPSMAESVSKKLKTLRLWPPNVVGKITADAIKVGGGTISWNKIEELTPLARVLQKRHGFGEEVFPLLLSLLKGGSAFSGGRAQETIREAKSIVSKLSAGHPLVTEFMNGTISDISEFALKARPAIAQEIRRKASEEEKNKNKLTFRLVLDSLDELSFEDLAPTEQKVLLKKLTARVASWSQPTEEDEDAA